jgi:hypothetical protein
MPGTESSDLFNTWNAHARNNNCYAFAFDALQPDAAEKLQPGDLSGMPEIPREDGYRCDDLLARIRADYPGVTPVDPDEPKPEGPGHRVALFVDNQGSLRDYHFYREMPDGGWWHKPGSLPVRTTDDSGRRITDPRTADRDYTRHGDEASNYNYATFCGMLWVPAGTRAAKTRVWSWLWLWVLVAVALCAAALVAALGT